MSKRTYLNFNNDRRFSRRCWLVRVQVVLNTCHDDAGRSVEDTQEKFRVCEYDEPEKEQNDIESINVCKKHLSENSDQGKVAENAHENASSFPCRHRCHYVVRARKKSRGPEKGPEDHWGICLVNEGV